MKEFMLCILDLFMYILLAMSFFILFCLGVATIISHFQIAIPTIIAFIVSIKYKSKSNTFKKRK